MCSDARKRKTGQRVAPEELSFRERDRVLKAAAAERSGGTLGSACWLILIPPGENGMRYN